MGRGEGTGCNNPGSDREPARKVAAAVLVDQGRVLIARRKAGQHLAGFWEFPGGKVEDGETPEACLRREYGFSPAAYGGETEALPG